MKKCVIIGSGLGGLSCACILSKNGYQVTVLEQGNQIGGCLQCFRRGDAIFDTGMHYVGSADPGQTLHTMLRYLGIDSKINLSRLDSSGYDVISLNGEHYRLANGKDGFINNLVDHFPNSRDELNRYFDLFSLVAASQPMHSLNHEINLEINAKYQRLSVNDVIDSVITDPRLREVLAGIQPLYAGEKNRTPFSTHALISDFYNQSAFRIIGGSSVIADSLVDVLTDMGSTVIKQSKACKIECNNNGAVAVITANGERYPADLVISAIHPSRTLELIDSHRIRHSYLKRLNSVRNTASAFTVYLKFKKDSVRYMNSNLFYYRNETTWGCGDYDESSWPKFMLYLHFCHQDNPTYAETGEIITYMKFDEVKQWQGTSIGNRGQSYEEFKRRKAEAVIDALEKEIPGIRGNIEQYYTSTPLTYLDYTGIPDGSMYGIAKDVSIPGSGIISSRTKIPKLLLTGQSITSHGMLGVLAGSFLTCAEVLSFNDIMSQLTSVA